MLPNRWSHHCFFLLGDWSVVAMSPSIWTNGAIIPQSGNVPVSVFDDRLCRSSILTAVSRLCSTGSLNSWLSTLSDMYNLQEMINFTMVSSRILSLSEILRIKCNFLNHFFSVVTFESRINSEMVSYIML